MKKLINAPEDFVDEFLDGIQLAHAGSLRAAGKRSVVRASPPHGRVGIVTGGGSGHLPLFLGYVGEGLCSGVAVGNVFSSPSAEAVLEATRASDGGKGVLYLIGNYGGDVMNFELAGEMAELEGIETLTVAFADDVLSAPKRVAATRRGVAGLVLAYKCAGAAAQNGAALDDVARVARKVNERLRSVGVGLSPTILPTAGKPTFELPDGQMEVGIGIHGEPGPLRAELETADAVADRLLDAITADLALDPGTTVAVLVNGLGATPLEELYLLYRRVHRRLVERQVEVRHVFVGEFATSLEMAGASISILATDPEIDQLLEAPASSPFFRR
jgi:dihydroxyacetone kinase-like protein